MSEPTLDKIEDYNTLSGEKRRVVWAVVAAGLLIGTIYTVAKVYFGTVDDEIVTEKVDYLPVK